jgi:hypothetical protein
MKRVSTMLRAVALVALTLWPAHAAAADIETGLRPPSAFYEVSLSLGLSMDAKAISLNGILSYGGGSSREDPIEVRTKSIELASAPNVFVRVRQGIVALRALGRATECVVAHCWRELSGTNEVPER